MNIAAKELNAPPMAFDFAPISNHCNKASLWGGT